METKVSVIIPVYNQEDLVIRALNSIPKRDDIDILVIDDCSTDRTYQYVNQYRKKSSQKIKLYQNIQNKGVGYTVNRGYSLARGEYVVLLGSDDYFYGDNFEKVMDELNGEDLVYFNLELNDGFVWELDDKSKHDYCGSVKFIRREFLGETRNPDMRAREDWYFNLELLKKNPVEKFSGVVVKHYNFPREGSLTWVACNGFK